MGFVASKTKPRGGKFAPAVVLSSYEEVRRAALPARFVLALDIDYTVVVEGPPTKLPHSLSHLHALAAQADYVVFVTSRSNRSQCATSMAVLVARGLLADAGFAATADHIVFAGDPWKGPVLAQFLQSRDMLDLPLVFVDDDERSLTNVAATLPQTRLYSYVGPFDVPSTPPSTMALPALPEAAPPSPASVDPSWRPSPEE